jgi:hypothetical protein
VHLLHVNFIINNVLFLFSLLLYYAIKYDKNGQQGKSAFNERNPHTTQQQESVARSLGGPPKKEQDRAQGRARTGQSTFYLRTNEAKHICLYVI